mgnify:CR=1 FL=1
MRREGGKEGKGVLFLCDELAGGDAAEHHAFGDVTAALVLRGPDGSELARGYLHERGKLLDGVGRERVAVGHRVDGGVDLGFLGLVLQRVVGQVLAHVGAEALAFGIVHEPLLVGQGSIFHSPPKFWWPWRQP